MMTTSVEARVLTDDVGEPILQKIDKALCELSNARDDVETGKHQSAILSFLRMAKEYIESVRDDIEVVTSAYLDNLSQPQPVAQGEAVAYWAAVSEDGIEHSYSTDDGNNGEAARQEINDWINSRLNNGGGLLRLVPLYATPTIPTGHRVVPDELVKAAAIECARRAYGYWKGDSTGGDSAMNYFDRNMGLGGIPHNIEMMESAIRKHIAAAPDAGGV